MSLRNDDRIRVENGAALLQRGGASRAVNLGNGGGFSVRQVIASVERLMGSTAPVSTGTREFAKSLQCRHGLPGPGWFNA